MLISCRLGTSSDASGFRCFSHTFGTKKAAMIYWYFVHFPSLLSIIFYLRSLYRNFLKNMKAISFHCSVFNVIYSAFYSTPWIKHRSLSEPLYVYDNTGVFIRFWNWIICRSDWHKYTTRYFFQLVCLLIILNRNLHNTTILSYPKLIWVTYSRS